MKYSQIVIMLIFPLLLQLLLLFPSSPVFSQDFSTDSNSTVGTSDAGATDGEEVDAGATDGEEVDAGATDGEEVDAGATDGEEVLNNNSTVGITDSDTKDKKQIKAKTVVSKPESHKAIEKKFNDLTSNKGFSGKPITQITQAPDGIGYFQYFKDNNGYQWAIYWSPSTGAHEIHGNIIKKWAKLNWEKGSLGYPVSDEKDLSIVKDGKYNEFEKGFIVWTPQKGAQQVKQLSEAKQTLEPVKKFKITFDSIYAYTSHDTTGAGFWDLAAFVNGKPVELLRGEGVDQDETVEFNNPNDVSVYLGSQRSIEVAIPQNGFFKIETVGLERDQNDQGPGKINGFIEQYYPKLLDKIKSKYSQNGKLSKTQTDLSLYNEIAGILKNQDQTWLKVIGAGGQMELEAYGVISANAIPVWGQIASVGYSVYKFVNFLSGLNADDGIGKISKTCSLKSSPKFCVGQNTLKSQYNGVDADSKGDYDLKFTVQEIK